MSTHRRSFYSLAALLVSVLAGIPITSAPPASVPPQDSGLIVGRNVNVVSGTQLPGGDPYLQRQNEPSIAASTRNPMHLMAGMNDYRTIDMPFEDKVPGLEFGNQALGRDAWLGVAKSFNGGQSWKTTLLPGFPQDTSQESLNNPLKMFGTAADPVVRAGTNGLFYYAGIAFNRVDRGSGVVFVARFIDLNNKENADTIKYDGVSIIDQGNAGQFLDKPWMAVDIPRAGHGHTFIGGQTAEIPCGNVYVAYSVFVGKTDLNIRSKILFRRSADCGRTWGPAVKLSESQHTDQGTAIAIDPASGAVYVAWRRFATASQENAILFVKSTDGGQTFTKPIVVRALGLSFPAGPGGPFDQRTTGSTFRTNSHPTITADQNGTVYLAWSERQADNQAKIMLTCSTNGGVTWATSAAIEGTAHGHQFMPSLAFAGGTVMLMWYDQRNDEAQLVPGSPALEDYYEDTYLGHRHTVDVRVARIEPANTEASSPSIHPSKQASRYRYKLVDWGSPYGLTLEKAERSFTGLTMFQIGTVPFLGDYIDLTPAPVFVMGLDGEWQYNTDPVDQEDPLKPLVTPFHLAWQDTRDVKLPGGNLWPSWSLYRAPNSPQENSFFPSHDDANNCDYTGMMNQNVYTACVTPGFVAYSPGNAKPLALDGQTDTNGFPVARAFAVTVKNMTDEDRAYRMTIEAPLGVYASFVQYFDLNPNAKYPNYPVDFPIDEMNVAIASQSTLSRPVFIYPYPNNPYASVKIHVSDVTDGTAAPTSVVVLNPDPTNPVIEQPDAVQQPHVKGEEVHNPHVKGVSIKNETQEYLVNPHVKGLDPTMRDVINSDTANPHVKGEVLNPHVKGLDIEAPHVKGTSISEITWEVTNEGNTTTPYTFDTFVAYVPPTNTDDPLAPGYVPPDQAVQFQLLIYKVYKTPAAKGCALVEEEHHELVANIANPHVKGPHVKGTPMNALSYVTPEEAKEATFWLNPGEKALVKLWAIDPVPGNGDDFYFGETGGEEVFDDVKAEAEVTSQAHNTQDVIDGHYDTLPSDSTVPPGPALISPLPGDALDNGCQATPSAGSIEWDFSWAPVDNASIYHLFVLGPSATIPAVNVDSIAGTTYHHSNPEAYVADINLTGWTWMVRARLNDGSWTGWSEVGSFNVGPATDCPATSPPDINIKQGAADIADGGFYDFGAHNVDSETDVAFTIENPGGTDLTLSGAPFVAIGGPDADQFIVQQAPVTPIASGQSTTFIVRFKPTSSGAKSASITIASDDTNETPYDISLSGTGGPAGGLVAHYPLDGNANDLSGYGNHGVVSGATPTADRSGNLNAAYSFDGVNDGIVIPNSASLTIGNFQNGYTIAAWVKLMGAPPAGNPQEYYGEMVNKGNAAFSIRTGSDARVEACQAYTGGVGCQTSRLYLSIGTWAFVAVTWNAGTGAWQMYLNGNPGIYTGSLADLRTYGTDNTVTIGRDAWYDRWHFNGVIDDVRIYNRALSAAEIQALFHQ